MKNNILKFSSLLFTLSILSFFTSCTKEESSSTSIDSVEMFAIEAQEDIQVQTRSGSGKCFELVYPIEIVFPDNSTLEVDSMIQIRKEAMAWKQANPDLPGRVKVVFPIEIITSDGTILSVDSFLELRELRKSCIDLNNSDKRPCFRLMMPVTINFPDGSNRTFQVRKNIRTALRLWKKNNPNATEHPTLQYPLSIKMKDGTIIEVESKEDLQAIKEDCKG